MIESGIRRVSKAHRCWKCMGPINRRDNAYCEIVSGHWFYYHPGCHKNGRATKETEDQKWKRHKIEVAEGWNEYWSEKRLTLQHGWMGSANPSRFILARDALLEAVLTALAGEFVED